MNWWYIGRGAGASVEGFSTLREGQAQEAPSDEPTVHLLVALDEVQKRSAEDGGAGWTNGLLRRVVGLSDGLKK
jgi:hypothetical protein